jgi:hypothetical protein
VPSAARTNATLCCVVTGRAGGDVAVLPAMVSISILRHSVERAGAPGRKTQPAARLRLRIGSFTRLDVVLILWRSTPPG